MKAKNLNGSEKRARKHWLLPVIALVGGLSLPVYVYANQEQCNACHEACASQFSPEYNACFYGTPTQDEINACLAWVNSQDDLCHDTCEGTFCN